ncbi:uncharacterized protein [Henckelia pumila]|uniref:uncharacterized protein n=1 Tax=Henckelia pumila TaxID=405737 RepID=UPI003C6E009B
MPPRQMNRRGNPPPPQNPLTALEQASATMMEGINALLGQQAARPRLTHDEDVAERFQKKGPKEFIGNTDPLVAEGWIRSLETIFAYMGLTDADKVKCTMYMLKDDAALWWEGAVHGVNMQMLTWEECRRMFFAKYFTEDVCSRIIREFMSLQQGDKTVVEYIKHFDRGCNDPLFRGLEIELQGHSIWADLVVLSLTGFDLILGMDWLAVNRASIDFRRRTVSVKPSNGNPFTFYASQSSSVSQLISFVCTRKLLRRGFQGFLASVVTASEPSSRSLSEIDIVCDYSDVFPKDVAGIPPAREVEFSIELMPDTVPISKAPYRLDPTKMKELKEQIQELLEKGFIRPSFYPWGAPVDFLGHVVSRDGIAVDQYKANVVADALSWKTSVVSCLSVQFPLQQEIQRFDLEFYSNGLAPRLAALTLQPALRDRIREGQPADEELQRLRQRDEAKGSLLYTVIDGIVQDLQSLCWWPDMKRDIGRFVSECLTCQQVKAENQRPEGLLRPLPIPEWKWENITMDFVVGLPRSARGCTAIWVIVHRLTKSAHFLPARTTFTLRQYTELYIKEIVRLHGIPVSIVSDRDQRFTSAFWKSLHTALGTRLLFSTAFHPKTDGQSEREIQVLEDLLRACVIDFQGFWETRLPLVEFTNNNSYQESIGMAPNTALYGRRCKSLVHCNEVGERVLLGPEIVQQTANVVT